MIWLRKEEAYFSLPYLPLKNGESRTLCIGKCWLVSCPAIIGRFGLMVL